jgi:carbon monoxide dehydrogenase subunit G
MSPDINFKQDYQGVSMTITRMLTATSTAILGFILAVAAVAQDVEGESLDLVTHNSVVIAATPAKIWPKIIDPSEWKAGAQLVATEGNPAEVGATFKAVMPDTPEQVAFYVTNVEVVPEQTRAVRLNTPEGALIGYAIWELTPAEGGTETAYHVYTQAVVPAAALASMSEAEINALRADYGPSNSTRFQSELETLKKLVETPASE